ncbi:MAG TPA: SDR family NAD(P)-dependent oxidoreductase [Polyangiales bacterium]|nr:SDR family NAD(P)-dependent oxidoreductase [Polyangiales bacterium]
MDSLRGKTAILTGASRGIGVHIARALAAEGMQLALSARSLEPIEALAAELRAAGARCIAVRADVAKAEDRSTLLSRTAAELGPVDVLVNNAALEANVSFAEFSRQDIEQMLHVDLVSPMLLTHELLPSLLARKSGHIVNIASLAGKSATPYNVPYSAAKGGLILFSHSLRTELRGSGVSCSVIVPGFISETGMYAEKEREHGVSVTPLVGTSRPEAVGRAVVRAIEKDILEIIVAPGPMRLTQAFNQIFPEAFAWIVTRAGAMEPFRRVAQAVRPEPR